MNRHTVSMSLLAAAVLLCAHPAAAAERDAGRIWITDVTIVSPEKLDRVVKGSVLIEDGRIAAVERDPVSASGRNAPAGATVVSGKGQFLIPGLIDSHVHLASVPGMGIDPMGANAALTRDYYRQLPRSYLYFGYTTLIDLIAYDAKALDDFRHAPLHPDLYDCGAAIAMANGYPMSFAPPAERFGKFPNFLYDPAQSGSIPAEYKAADHTAAADVARVKASGAICVKTFFERGFGRDSNLPVPSAEQYAQIRSAASDARLVLMTHANSLEAQKFAVDGHTDVLAHGMWNWGKLNPSSELPPEAKEVLDRIVQDHIGYQPTMQVIVGLRAYFDPAYLGNPAIPKVIPRDMLAWFRTPAGQWFKAELNDDGSPDAVVYDAMRRGPIRHVQQVVAYLAAKDANFLFGTDTPSSPTYGNLPGLNGYLEMQQLTSAGMSLAQLFKAATLGNARAFKLDGQVGTIEVGKVANLALLKKSPLESVDAYDSVVSVWVHGKQIAREDLAADAPAPK